MYTSIRDRDHRLFGLARVDFNLTALAMPADESKCIEGGANTYLRKSVSVKELSKVVARFANDFQD